MRTAGTTTCSRSTKPSSYYNKVRADYPSQPIKLFYSTSGTTRAPVSRSQYGRHGQVQAARTPGSRYYVKGEGGEPADAKGGVDDDHEHLPADRGAPGQRVHRHNWASLAPGEIRFNSAAGTDDRRRPAQRRRPRVHLAATMCTTQAAARQRLGGEYKIRPSPGERLHDRRLADGDRRILDARRRTTRSSRACTTQTRRGTEQLIGAQTYRPLNVGRRLHQAGLPAAPAGLEGRRRARRQARAAGRKTRPTR